MIRILVDSGSDYRSAAGSHDAFVPLTVSIGGRDYQDGVDLTGDRFYHLLTTEEEFPKTSQPSPEAFFKIFRTAKIQGNEMLCFSLSSALSGTYQSATIAKEMVDYDGIYIVDTCMASHLIGFLVDYARKAIEAGKEASQIAQECEELKCRIRVFAGLDTLEYLYKGGRISQTAYTLGSLAQIKPIIKVDEQGGITVPAKAMGMRKGMDLLSKRIQTQIPDPEFPLYVMFTNNRAVAETLAAKLRPLGYEIPDDHIIGVGAAIGAHVGPDACGVVYIEKK